MPAYKAHPLPAKIYISRIFLHSNVKCQPVRLTNSPPCQPAAPEQSLDCGTFKFQGFVTFIVQGFFTSMNVKVDPTLTLLPASRCIHLCQKPMQWLARAAKPTKRAPRQSAPGWADNSKKILLCHIYVTCYNWISKSQSLPDMQGPNSQVVIGNIKSCTKTKIKR